MFLNAIDLTEQCRGTASALEEAVARGDEPPPERSEVLTDENAPGFTVCPDHDRLDIPGVCLHDDGVTGARERYQIRRGGIDDDEVGVLAGQSER